MIELKTEVHPITLEIAFVFTRSNIDYTIFHRGELFEVWKTNNQRGGQISSDTFRNGSNHLGKKTPKFLAQVFELIAA